MACGSRGGERGRGVVVIAAAAADRPHRVVVGIDGEGVAVGREGGRVGGVAGNGYRARILRVAVVPLHKVVPSRRRGCEGGRLSVGVAAAASGAAHGGIVGVDGEGVTVDGESCRIGGGGRDRHRARVLRVAVVPLYKVVPRRRRGCEGGGGAGSIGAASADAAHRGIVCIDREGVLLHLGGKLHIVDGGRRIVAVAMVVVPHEHQFVVACGGHGKVVAGRLPRGLVYKHAGSDVQPAGGDGGTLGGGVGTEQFVGGCGAGWAEEHAHEVVAGLAFEFPVEGEGVLPGGKGDGAGGEAGARGRGVGIGIVSATVIRYV